MFQVINIPTPITTLLCISETELLLIKIALNYTLRHIRYNAHDNTYYLHVPDSGEDHTVIYPEELSILKNLCAQITQEG